MLATVVLLPLIGTCSLRNARKVTCYFNVQSWVHYNPSVDEIDRVTAQNLCSLLYAFFPMCGRDSEQSTADRSTVPAGERKGLHMVCRELEQNP